MSDEKSEKPKFKLFGGKNNKHVENTGPLQRDTQQAQLVEEARRKKASSGEGSKKSFSSKLKDAVKNVTGGGGGKGKSDSAGKGSDAPPPLPKKPGEGDGQDFLFCGECGAKNKLFRTKCVSCEAALEVPEALRDSDEANNANSNGKGKGKNNGKPVPPPPKKKKPQIPDPDKSNVTGEGIESRPQAANGKARFEVEIVDTEGKPIKEGGHAVKVQIEGPRGEVTANVEDNKDGTFSVDYDQTQPGKYAVQVLLNDKDVADSPYELEVELRVSGDKSSAEGDALDNGVIAKEPCDFFVTLRDVCGNPCVVGGAKVEATALLEDGTDNGATVTVRDENNGSYIADVHYPAQGVYHVNVLVHGEALSGSPFVVKVEKPLTAGAKWQNRFNDEAAERRKNRERERLEEIETAKRNYLEHAAEAKALAADKEAKQLAEQQRQRDIAEHMERMRTEEGDEVRARVLEKVKSQATDDIYEPTAEEQEEDAKTGKKWAAKFNEEDRARREQREKERQAEIAAARDNYVDHASQAVFHALEKEDKQLREEERLRQIDEHQKAVRLQNNLGGAAVIAGEDSGSTVSDEELKEEDLAAVADDDDDSSEQPKKKAVASAPAAKASGKGDEDSSELTPSSDDDAPPRPKAKAAAPPSSDDDDEPPALPKKKVIAPREDDNDDEEPKPAKKSAGDKKTPQRRGRGDIPDSKGVVVPYEELKNNSSRFLHSDDVDINILEAYLSDAEFQKVLAMTREKFYQLPPWRRLQLKKEKGLV